MTADPYRYWREGLKLTGGKRALSRDEQRDMGLSTEPQAGFWRRRLERGGGYVPVALWKQGDEWRAIVNGRSADAEDVWTYCCNYPVTEDTYRAAANGEPWHDEDTGVTASASTAEQGHNQPPQEESEILKGQIEAASANIGDYVEINDDDTASKAQSLRSRLNELSNTADKKRETEKRPHFEAAKAVDLKWQPLVKLAKEGADAIRKAMSDYETRKAKAAAEERRKIEDAQRKAAEAAAKAAEAGRPAPAPPPPPPPTAPVAPPKTQVKGSYGKAAAVKVVYTAVLETPEEAILYFRQEPELLAVVQKLAQRAVDAGQKEIPGVKIEERRDVR
jgi:hypothetical protein